LIHIIAPDIWEKDAVGNFCLDLSKLLTENNINVSLYAQNFSKEETPNVHNIDSFFINIKNDDVIFLSYSIYDKYLEKILELPNKKICYFHGVTPAHLLEEFEPITAELCRKSVEQFPLLDKFNKVIANSKFIANELEQFINKEVLVLPPIFPSRYILNDIKNIKNKNKDFLVVGRVVPHKKVENSIKLFVKIKELMPEARLRIIGSMPNHIYNEFLKEEVNRSGLNGCIVFKGIISDEELKEFYTNSYGFINASLHEGFSIPVLEALYYGLVVFVQSGHAAEELLNSDIKSIDFNSLDNLDLENLLINNKINKIEYIVDILSKNCIYTWSNILIK
jgi:glycosyltransferase involved in cell wall biosynthesis